MRVPIHLMLTAALVASACSERAPTPPRASAPQSPDSASVPVFTREARATPADAAPLPPAPDAGAAPFDAGADAGVAPAALPDVEIKNVGMHIGGGPNDSETKRPIREAVKPHYDAFRACFALLEDKTKLGTFGVDLHIDRDGGRAKITKPRDSYGTPAFERCMVAVFERVEFPRPSTRAPMVVSFSLELRPKRGR